MGRRWTPAFQLLGGRDQRRRLARHVPGPQSGMHHDRDHPPQRRAGPPLVHQALVQERGVGPRAGRHGAVRRGLELHHQVDAVAFGPLPAHSPDHIADPQRQPARHVLRVQLLGQRRVPIQQRGQPLAHAHPHQLPQFAEPFEHQFAAAINHRHDLPPIAWRTSAIRSSSVAVARTSAGQPGCGSPAQEAERRSVPRIHASTCR